MTVCEFAKLIETVTFRMIGLILIAGYSTAANPSYDSAKAAFDKGDHAMALSECKADAARVDAQCENLIGVLYASGLGVPRDLNTAVDYFKKSASRGNMKAQQSLAIAYMKGFGGVRQDQRMAFEWMLKSAEQGWAPAQLVLGSFYELGEGTDKSDEKAVLWWRRAANQDSTEPIARQASTEAKKALETIQHRLDTAQQAKPGTKSDSQATQKSDTISTSKECSMFASSEINRLNEIFSEIRRCDGKTCSAAPSYFDSTGYPIGEWWGDIVSKAMTRQRAFNLQTGMPGGQWERLGAFHRRIISCVPEAKAAAGDAIAFANRPDEKLKGAYMQYMGMQACYESRKNYVVKYVTSADLDVARSATKETEQSLVKVNPGLSGNVNAIWASAGKEFSATSQIAMGARIAGEKHNSLMAEQCSVLRLAFRLQLGGQSEKRKKDF